MSTSFPQEKIFSLELHKHKIQFLSISLKNRLSGHVISDSRARTGYTTWIPMGIHVV